MPFPERVDCKWRKSDACVAKYWPETKLCSEYPTLPYTYLLGSTWPHIRGHLILFYFAKCWVLVTKTKSPREWAYTCCSLENIWAEASVALFIPYFQRWQTHVPAVHVYPKQTCVVNNPIYISVIYFSSSIVNYNTLILSFIQSKKHIAYYRIWPKTWHLNIRAQVCAHWVLIL